MNKQDNLNMLISKKMADFTFILMLISLPFSEWKFIQAPTMGRPFAIDFSAPKSSIAGFEIVAFLFFLSQLPSIYKFGLKKIFTSKCTLYWIPYFIITIFIWIAQKPILPWLSPVGTIDVRNYLACLLIALSTGVYIATKPIEKLVRFAMFFYSTVILSSLALIYCAFNKIGYFENFYPFLDAEFIGFPFPSQNNAAFFFSLSLIGFLGLTPHLRYKSSILTLFPIILMTVALTGSRSAFFLCLFFTIVFCIITTGYYFLPDDKQSIRYKNFVFVPAALLLGIFLVFSYNNQKAIQKSFSVIRMVIQKPQAVLFAEKGQPRQVAWLQAISAITSNKSEFASYYELDNKLSTEMFEHKGSLHNVYLDFLLYIGRPAGILFIIATVYVVFSYFSFLMRQRNSRYFSFLLSVQLQLIVVAGMWYFHPYWWVKCAWMTIGVAMGLVLHGELETERLAI